MILTTVSSRAQDDQSLVLKGNQSYRKQQYEKAAEEYQKAVDLNPKDSKAYYNLGNALYKTKKTEAAQKAFEAAADNAKDAASKAKALYNKGVAYSRANQLAESIQAYKETLRINPTDEEARQNLQKALNELKKQPPPTPQNQNKKQDKQQNQKQPEQQKNNSKLSKKQVEQMLNALRQDEKKLQQDIQKKNNVGVSASKDW